MFAVLAPKRKSGRETHRTRPRAFEQAVNYTETTGFKQPRTRAVYKALKRAFTISLTVRPSAFLPAKAAWAAFITLPMSRIEFAPVSAMAALTAFLISFFDAGWGQVGFDDIDLGLFLIDQFLAAGFFILLDRVASLFDE